MNSIIKFRRINLLDKWINSNCVQLYRVSEQYDWRTIIDEVLRTNKYVRYLLTEKSNRRNLWKNLRTKTIFKLNTAQENEILSLFIEIINIS